MDLAAALDFARPRRSGVLTTLKRDGRPQLSNIAFGIEEAGTIGISVTATRAKSKNASRDPRVSLYVPGDNFGAYAVIDGDATVTPAAQAPDDDTVEQLIALYRLLEGEHPDWDDYRRAMVADERQVLRITPTHGYGMVLG